MVAGVTAGIFVVGAAIAVTGLLPYYRLMERSTGERLQELMDHRSLRVEQFHRRVLTVAEQIASRTQLRLNLAAYNRGELTLAEFITASDDKLFDALLPSSDAMGVSRYDPSGRRLISVGKPAGDPGARLPVLPDAVQLYRVFVRDGAVNLVVIGPIRQRDGSIAGFDAVRFRGEKLAGYIESPGSERFGERYFLYTTIEAQPRLLWPPPEREAPPTAAVRKIVAGLERDGAPSSTVGQRTIMVSQVQDTPFLLSLSVPSAAIHEPVRRRIATIALITAFLALVGSAATVLLTQPLVRRMAFYARTLEEQLQAHTKALAESEERYRTMFEESPLGVALYDAGGKLQQANRASFQLFGLPPEGPPSEITIFGEDSITSHTKRRLRSGESVRGVVQIDFAGRDRQRFHDSSRTDVGVFQTLVTPLMVHGQDPEGYLVHVVDITEQTQARMRMAKSLEEKEVLLREVHHRVKNNLQIISSLLNLQLANTTDPTSRKTLEESRLRITSMALIHEHLYQSESLAQIPFADYLRSLVYSIAQTHQVHAKAIDVGIDCPPVALTMGEAIPCGLIVNELLANAFEHAFPGREQGRVTVRFGLRDDDSYIGVVEDDGVGLSEGFSVGELRSLGVKLVQSLIQQLDGELAVAGDDGGVRWTFTFPRKSDEPAAAVAD
jgi:PAS domain S-box-containing protein